MCERDHPCCHRSETEGPVKPKQKKRKQPCYQDTCKVYIEESINEDDPKLGTCVVEICATLNPKVEELTLESGGEEDFVNNLNREKLLILCPCMHTVCINGAMKKLAESNQNLEELTDEELKILSACTNVCILEEVCYGVEIPCDMLEKVLPSGNPEEELPSGNPEEELPSGNPEEELPSGNPEEELPSENPEEELPSENTEEELPSENPEEELPSENPEEALAVETPEENNENDI